MEITKELCLEYYTKLLDKARHNHIRAIGRGDNVAAANLEKKIEIYKTTIKAFEAFPNIGVST